MNRLMKFSYPVHLLILALIHPAVCKADDVAKDVFLDQIQPLLAEHCLQCHGQDENTREGGLRLDQRQSALEGGDSEIPTIVPDAPDRSELIRRLTTEDESERMPPSPDHPRLSEAQIQLLSNWIEDGAKYATHWSFVAPRKADLSNSEQEASLTHPIDQLVARVQKRVGIQRSPAADDQLLCRRLYLDTIGLPPTPEQLQRFKEVGLQATLNELMNSPRYGEKWARHWMDAARYSDTNGYEKDLKREQWVWREWVINAINEDLPFNEFIIQQIAGDLLPDGNQDTLVATGFLRNSMLNEEGAIIPEQFRMVEMFDRIDCVGKAVLGMTTQCAQCHSHKYDPISMTEYYGLFAFLNNSYEAQSWIYTDQQQAIISEIKRATEDLENQIKSRIVNWEEQVQSFEDLTKQRLAEWTPVRFHDMNSVSGLNHPVHEADDLSILMLGHTSADVYLIGKPSIDAEVTGIQLEVLTHSDLPFNGPGRNSVGSWAVRELELFYREASTSEWQKLELTNATADYSSADEQQDEGKKALGPVTYLIDGNDQTQWKSDRGLGKRNASSVAVVQLETPIKIPEQGEIKVVMRMSDMIGCCRISLTSDPAPKASTVAHDAVLAMSKEPDSRTSEEHSAIFTAWRLQNPEAEQENNKIVDSWKAFPTARTSVLHLQERTGSKQRITHRLDRGNWDSPKETIDPHVPTFLHSMDQDTAEPARLRFARWLTDSRSPLTARVMVNRIWQQIFGTGLVDTSEDLGMRTKPPVQQALLDWLAVDLMEHNWSRKHLLNRILTSETYQQDSRISTESYAKDPTNLYLARGPRFRADAEVIRDIALSVSGLIHHQMGGPSVIPPVPQNVLDYNYVYPSYWKPATGPDRYRRAVYSFRKRSMPDPSMSSLDAPNADTACVRRVRSNTPLAALTTLNETIFIEAARALAIRILSESPNSDIERIQHAYLLCVSRLPSATEEQSMIRLLDAQRTRVAEGWLNPRMITTGNADQLPELPPNTTPQDAAAWTFAARVLLNLDETISKN